MKSLKSRRISPLAFGLVAAAIVAGAAYAFAATITTDLSAPVNAGRIATVQDGYNIQNVEWTYVDTTGATPEPTNKIATVTFDLYLAGNQSDVAPATTTEVNLDLTADLETGAVFCEPTETTGPNPWTCDFTGSPLTSDAANRFILTVRNAAAADVQRPN